MKNAFVCSFFYYEPEKKIKNLKEYKNKTLISNRSVVIRKYQWYHIYNVKQMTCKYEHIKWQKMRVGNKNGKRSVSL